MSSIANPVVNVSVGGTVSTALDDSGLLWAWGSNELGELGVGDCEPRLKPFPILSLKDKQVSSVACGDAFVLCLGQKISRVPVREQEQVLAESEQPQLQAKK